MLCLNISQTYAKLNITTTRPVLNIKTTRPELEIDTEAAKVEVRQAKGELEIDSTPYRYSIGYKNVQAMARDNAEAGRQQVLETIARISQEGDRMARIESKEDAIVSMAAESNSPEPPDITWAPIAAPNVSYKPGQVQIDVTPGNVTTNLKRGTVTTDLERGTVDIRVAAYGSVKYWTTENKYDRLA